MLKHFIMVFSFFSFISLISLNQSSATMFVPLSIEKQVEQASAAAEVKLINSKTFKNKSGMIVTEYSFEVVESYNLMAEDLDHHQLKLILIGGSYNGLTTMIDGAPVFNIGEKVFLLLKKVEDQIYLSNFTLGKYKIVEDSGKIYYISDVFPQHPVIGKISKDKMIEIIKEKWIITNHDQFKASSSGDAITSSLDTDPEFKTNQSIKRLPAQNERDENLKIPLFFWWSIGIFISFFGFIFYQLEKSKTENKREEE